MIKDQISYLTIFSWSILFVNIYLSHGQNGKDFSIWNYPQYEDEIFNTSFLSETLRKNLEKEDFKGYFFASNRDWDDVEDGLYDIDGVALRKSDSIYFPTLIIRTALTSYYEWQETDSPKAIEVFKAQINWLSKNFYECEEKYGFWVFTNYSNEYKLPPGWTSVMSQGMGIGVCLMAYNVTKDENYLRIADLALKGFFVPVENGGFKRNLNGKIWFEEYPTINPSITLNGFIFGIAGLYNFYQNSQNEQINSLFNESVRTLEENIEMFSGAFTSYYSMKAPFHFAKDSYHKIHTFQLAWLYEVSQLEKFKVLSQYFLDIHVNKFKINGDLNFTKIKEITSNECINCHEYGPTNLIDDNWSWGKYWSAYKNPELAIQLNEERKVLSIILYGLNLHSIMMGMSIYNDENGELLFMTPEANGLDGISYFKTGKYETYVRKIPFPKAVFLNQVRVTFSGTSREKVIALREIQFEISMDKEFDMIMDWIRTNKNI